MQSSLTTTQRPAEAGASATSKAKVNPSHDYTVISFSNPFLYQPLRGAAPNTQNPGYGLSENIRENVLPFQERALTFVISPPESDVTLEDFDYVPQALIDWMVSDFRLYYSIQKIGVLATRRSFYLNSGQVYTHRHRWTCDDRCGFRRSST